RIRGSGDVLVGEGPQHVNDGVDLADVGEELVAEALAGVGALDKPTDVDELNAGVHGPSGAGHLGQRLQATVGDLGDPDVGVGGGEGVGGGQGATAGQRVVEGGLARVG